MEIMALCDICGKLMVKHTCALCGVKLCPVCFDQKNRMCKNCASGRRQ